MEDRSELPADFLVAIRDLEPSYLWETDPIRQSGFGGGPERWRAEREPILDAIGGDGELLDVGCANGYLLECLVRWGRERDLTLVPYGVDLNPRLVELARRRLPAFKENFFVANAWEWQPKGRFRFVYALSHCVPDAYLEAFVERLLSRAVEPGGTLILGDYGSRSQAIPPRDFRERLERARFSVQGTAVGGAPPVSSFVWLVNGR